MPNSLPDPETASAPRLKIGALILREVSLRSKALPVDTLDALELNLLAVF